MKKFIIVVSVIVVIALAVSFILISRQPDSGVSEIETYDEYVEWL